jgi:hypothetical protein
MEITRTKNGLFRIILPWLTIALLVPLVAVAFTAKPAYG